MFGAPFEHAWCDCCSAYIVPAKEHASCHRLGVECASVQPGFVTLLTVASSGITVSQTGPGRLCSFADVARHVGGYL